MGGNPILFNDPLGLIKNDPNKDPNVAKPTEVGQHRDYEDGHLVSERNSKGELVWTRGTTEIVVTPRESVPNVLENLGLDSEPIQDDRTDEQIREDLVNTLNGAKIDEKLDLLRKIPFVKKISKSNVYADLALNPTPFGDGEIPDEWKMTPEKILAEAEQGASNFADEEIEAALAQGGPIDLGTSSKKMNPSRVYTIYDDNGNLYKFGVTDENLNRLGEVPGKLPKTYKYRVSRTVFPKFKAHIMEKYLRSLHFASTGQWRLEGMKIPHPHNLTTGVKIPKPGTTNKVSKARTNRLRGRKR